MRRWSACEWISPNLPSFRCYVALLLDEMKVKERLVCNKHTGEFTHLGDINDELLEIQRSGEELTVTKHVLVWMVWEIMFKPEFPLVHFVTKDVSGDILFPIVWEAVQQLKAHHCWWC